MIRAGSIDLMIDGVRIGRLERIGTRWQAFRVCQLSDELKFAGTFDSKADAKAAVVGRRADAA